MKKKIQTITILKIVAILMLLWALTDNPYFYYQIQKWVICGVTGYSAYLAYENKRIVWTWIFGIIAVLFNPMAPIYLNRDLWSIIDIIVAVIIFVSFFKFKVKKTRKFTHQEEAKSYLMDVMGLSLQEVKELERQSEEEKKLPASKNNV